MLQDVDAPTQSGTSDSSKKVSGGVTPISPSSMRGGGGAIVLYVPQVRLEERLMHEASVADLVVASPYEKEPAATRIALVADAFNKNVKEKVIVDAGARHGDRIEPGMFLLAHCNKVPEVAIGKGERLTLRITTGYTQTGYIGRPDGKYQQSEVLIGEYGSHILNVPLGKLAKVWSGNEPKLFGEGCHVIHDTLFRADTNGENLLVDVSSQHISHGTIHIVRVPLGSLGKVMIDSKPVLLPYRSEPYGFYTAFLKFEGFAKQSDSNIELGSLHLIRVPSGSVAKAWLGSKSLLLEYRDEPYFFDDPLFKLNPTNGFESANVKHIQHGSINRLRPGVDGDLELAVLQHDGELTLVDKFTTVDDPNDAVLGFLNMGMQTLVFPSKETRNERRRENPKATDIEVCFEPMTTRDSLKVGLKLLVVFQVNDPQRVLRKLRLADIISHVENLAVSDIARAVQNSTSQNFLLSSSVHHDDMDEKDMSVTDLVRRELAKHLDDCGLKLVRFNIEEAKVLDEDLAKEMSKQALVAAAVSAEQAVIAQKAAVARSNAELEAMARRVKQDQENLINIAAAEANLKAERLRAQAIVVLAEAEQKKWAMTGELYQKYPELLQLEITRLQMTELARCSVTVIAPDLATTPFLNFPTGMPTVAACTAKMGVTPKPLP